MPEVLFHSRCACGCQQLHSCLTMYACVAKAVELTLRDKGKSSVLCCADVACVQIVNGSTHNGTKHIPWPKRADSTLYARRHCSRSLLSLLSVHMCICLMYLRLRGVSLWAAPRLLGLGNPRRRFHSGRFFTPVARAFVCRVRCCFDVETTHIVFTIT